MKIRGYSYTRFSTAEQSKGKSLERQTEAAALWCKNNNVELDTELCLHDAGVSAFRGKNRVNGALGSFLKAVHAGQVPVGSFLLIETWDRLSREAAYDAQLTLQNLIQSGVNVVTLMDGKVYNVAILRADPIALIYAILLMSRASEESQTKSKRVADAWSRKRDALKQGKKLTARIPTWIELKNNKFTLIPSKAKTIERMFNMFLEGEGCNAIARHFNEKRVPGIGDGKFWRDANIQKMLSNRTVLGEFQPHRENNVAGKSRNRVPEGEPIKNYYPAVIKPSVFERVQRMKKQRRGTSNTTGPLKNMFAGLARCPGCGGLMCRKVSSNRQHPSLVCMRARVSAGCKYRSVAMHVLETKLIDSAATLVTEIPLTDADVQAKILSTETALKENEARVFDLAMLLDGTPSRVIAGRIAAAEGTCEKLQVELDALQAKAQYGNARRIKGAAQNMREALLWHKQDPSDVARVNASLRDCFSKIIVRVEDRQMILHWRHGGEATLNY